MLGTKTMRNHLNLRTGSAWAARIAGALLLSCAGEPARAHEIAMLEPAGREASGPTDRFAPGEFAWYGDAAGSGEILVSVSLAEQVVHVYRAGELVGVSTISSGRPGYETPRGVYTVLQKKRTHRSNLYDDAPMPFMQRLTWDGIALHAGHLPGYPASHGCIRLPKRFAQKLFGLTGLGTTVIVGNELVLPEKAIELGLYAEAPVLPDVGAPALVPTARTAAELNREALSRLTPAAR